MATEQEILKARTFRVAESLRDSEYSAKDADWYRKKMGALVNAHRYIRGTLESVWLFPPGKQSLLEYLTPWEREWSVLARSYAGGFTPIVDENGTIIAHRGVTSTYDSTPLIAPYGDLLYTLPEATLRNFELDTTSGKTSDVGISGKDLLELLKDGANVFVHGRDKTLALDWRRLRYSPAETKLTLMVSIDGQLFDFVPSMTGFLKEGYSPADILIPGQILTTFGKIGTRHIKALVRKAGAKAEAREVLGGPTLELAKKADAKLKEQAIVHGAGAAKNPYLYKPSPKHGPGGWGSPQPKSKEPGALLASSDPVVDGQRIAYDRRNNEIIVFRRESTAKGGWEYYHGYVVKWAELTNRQKSVLIKAKQFKPTGKPTTEDVLDKSDYVKPPPEP
jgi:hypothetical protein